MPQQELFFQQELNGQSVEVIKTYDQQFAKEAFKNMDEFALEHLWMSMKPEGIYEIEGLPKADQVEERSAFLWDELVEQAREDGRLFSFFIVTSRKGRHTENLYIGPDWPSAESFAQNYMRNSVV